MITDRLIWDELAADLSHGSGIVRRRIPALNGVDLFLAVDSDSGLPAVIVESASDIISSVADYTSIGFTLSTVRIDSTQISLGIRIILRLSDARYKEIFYVLVDDVTSCMLAARNEGEALKVFLSRISLWKKFFQKYKEKGLTREEQQGIWGELWTMKQLLFPLRGISDVIASWAGPESGTQDFYLAQNAIEVKTSTIPPHEKFQVAGVRQLDFRGSGKLLLIFHATETKPGKENSLPTIIRQIRDEISNEAPSVSDSFECKLKLAGYFDSQSAIYDEISFYVRKTHIFHVSDAFPRLLERNLPNGIGDLRYTVSISACKDSLLSNDEFTSIMK